MSRSRPQGDPTRPTAAAAGRPAGSSATRVFTEQLEPETPVLLRVAATLTGSWADAEDLVQETMIRAWRAADRFDGAHPRAWLLTILRHVHLNSLRRQRPRLLDGEDRLDHLRPAFGPAQGQPPDERVLDRTLSPGLEEAVRSLKPTFRTVLLLIDVDQLSYAETAELLGLPMGTVVSRLYRARGKLRRRLLPVPAAPGKEPR